MSPDRRPTASSPAGTTGSAGMSEALLPERTKGDTTALVTIYEFSDFQCPFCRDFWEQTLPIIEQEYVRSGKVRFVFLNFPLKSIHRHAVAAHRYAMCAAGQGGFWPFHDLLYRHQARWAAATDAAPMFRGFADSARLDQRALTSCVLAGEVDRIVQGDAADGRSIRIQSTPSFLVDRMLLVGAHPITTWRPILDSIYASKTGGQ
jgi:protein-disulfide isomerase